METHGKCESYLVASSDIDLESAIRCAYDLGSADKIGDTASLLRQEINDICTRECAWAISSFHALLLYIYPAQWN
jgi:hypothetical protein